MKTLRWKLPKRERMVVEGRLSMLKAGIEYHQAGLNRALNMVESHRYELEKIKQEIATLETQYPG